MTLFFTLLPLYLFGNVHCFGMCGPLVMLIGQHRFRHLYFAGRILSFSLAGLIAGELGAVLHVFLKQYYLAESISIVFGVLIILMGLHILFNWRWLDFIPRLKPLQSINRALSLLMLKETPWSTFLFGFFTVALPCGQTLIVFSACALTGDALVGLTNGFAFALLTTPSLVVAMHAFSFFKTLKKYYQTILGLSSVAVGLLACCRGFAEMGIIPHLVVNPQSPSHYHVVIF
jgi:hypothetical protein